MIIHIFSLSLRNGKISDRAIKLTISNY